FNSEPDTDTSIATLRQSQPPARKYHPLGAIVALPIKYQNISSFIASSTKRSKDNYGSLSTLCRSLWRSSCIHQSAHGHLWTSSKLQAWPRGLSFCVGNRREGEKRTGSRAMKGPTVGQEGRIRE